MCKYKGGKPACIMKVTVVGSPWGAQFAGQYASGERSEYEVSIHVGTPKMVNYA